MCVAKVIVNGIPKHGTHLLLRAVEVCGVAVTSSVREGEATLYHLPFSKKKVFETKHALHLFTKRNPRNAFISLLRSERSSLDSETLMNRMKNINGHGLSYVRFCKPFLDWLYHPQVVVIDFDNLVSDPSELERIAIALGKPFEPSFHAKLNSPTRTWTGNLSNWTKLESWTDEVEMTWEKIGGVKLDHTFANA